MSYGAVLLISFEIIVSLKKWEDNEHKIGILILCF